MMWEIIEQMATERLWIYTALAGSIFGALFIYWIRDTYIAFWAINKWQNILDFLVNRWGWTWFKHNPNAWKAANPKLTAKIKELEERIIKLEKK